jgi:hypothetical protein
MKRKRCSKCKQFLPKVKKGHYCAKCAVIAREAWKARRLQVTPEEKMCNRCKIVKPAKEFYNDSLAKTGLTSNCKDCYHEKKFWRLYSQGKDNKNEKMRVGLFPDLLYKYMLETCDSRCYLCGEYLEYTNIGERTLEEANHPKAVSIHHLIRRSENGTHAIENIVLVHKDCNLKEYIQSQKKNDKSDDESTNEILKDSA